MAKTQEPAARFKMIFPAAVLDEPIMYTLSKKLKVRPNIKRGRISDSNAWLEIEIKGTEKAVDKAVAYLKGKGVTITAL